MEKVRLYLTFNTTWKVIPRRQMTSPILLIVFNSSWVTKIANVKVKTSYKNKSVENHEAERKSKTIVS